MSRRRSRRGAEQRQRLFVLLGKLLAAGGILAVTAYYAYEVGFRVARGESATLADGLQKAEERLRSTEAGAETDRVALTEANRQLAALKAAYEQVRPSDEVRDLTALLRDKLAAGMTSRRLALVIKSAEMPRACQALASRRLPLPALRAKAPSAVAPLRFDEKIVLSAEEVGDSAERPQDAGPLGNAALKVHFSADGLRDADVVGALPLEYALQVQGFEYHFTVTTGSAKGWLEVAAEKCRFR